MKGKTVLLAVFLLVATGAFAQGMEPAFDTTALLFSQGPAMQQKDEAAEAESSSSRTQLNLPGLPASGFIAPVAPPARRFDWNAAARQSFYFLSLEHGFRMVQRKTRRELGGKFWDDYLTSAGNVQGWGDGDGFFTNYVGHPLQGSVSGYIHIQNDPGGRQLEFENTRAYWMSRTRAFGWAALYSTQFELGLVSESTIGNVGKKKGTHGYVDLVMTPVGGFGMMVAEDALDRYVVQKLERGTHSKAKVRFYRMFFNPSRSLANVFRMKVPWHRDTRNLVR